MRNSPSCPVSQSGTTAVALGAQTSSVRDASTARIHLTLLRLTFFTQSVASGAKARLCTVPEAPFGGRTLIRAQKTVAGGLPGARVERAEYRGWNSEPASMRLHTNRQSNAGERRRDHFLPRTGRVVCRSTGSALISPAVRSPSGIAKARQTVNSKSKEFQNFSVARNPTSKPVAETVHIANVG